MQSRLNLPTRDEMSLTQRDIHDAVLATRGNVQGPFLAWLLSPGLADPAQQLGAFCRYHTSLSLLESELLILHVAAHYQCPGEQIIHEPIALQAGLGAAVVESVRNGETPELAAPRMAMLSGVARALLTSKRLPRDLYADAASMFGQTTLVEVVGLIGYYALVAYTLNAFEMMPSG